jgi:hypothetical protein
MPKCQKMWMAGQNAANFNIASMANAIKGAYVISADDNNQD